MNKFLQIQNCIILLKKLGNGSIIKFYLILSLSILASFLEMVGIGSLVPILSLIVQEDPQKALSSLPLLPELGVEITRAELIFYVSVLVILIFLIKSLVLIALAYYQARFVFETKGSISKKMFGFNVILESLIFTKYKINYESNFI